MATDLSKVGVGVTGQVSRAPLGTAAPTTQATALNASFIDVGFIGEDGITQSLTAVGDLNTFNAWQNSAVVRSVRNTSDELPTFQFTMVETKAASLETYFGTTVTSTATEGSLVYNATALRTRYSWVFDVVDGSELDRTYVPDGLVVEVGDRVYSNDDLISYEVTVEAQYNATLAGHFKYWTTRAKS